MNTTVTSYTRHRFNDRESTALNYAKAIGIITVVIGHFRGVPFNYFQPYMYHMPLFFFLGGVFINEFRSLYQHSVGLVQFSRGELFCCRLVPLCLYAGLIDLLATD